MPELRHGCRDRRNREAAPDEIGPAALSTPGSADPFRLHRGEGLLDTRQGFQPAISRPGIKVARLVAIDKKFLLNVNNFTFAASSRG